MKNLWRVLALVAVFAGFGAATFVSPAAAEDTVWLCKPGQVDDLCAGSIAGNNIAPPGQAETPLGYTRPDEAPIDCFYLYPTQSEQATPNSNLDKDPPIRRVGVQQARMFSSICDVYAPMYRQVTFSGNQGAYNPDVETAYQSALSGFRDYLNNYNDGRGFILIGHSQGSAHTARLIKDEIDGNPELRDRFIGGYAPGANIYVPKNELVGGMYQNVPACSQAGEIGCLVAFSTFKGYPGDVAAYSRVDSGYWIHNEPRVSQDEYEVACVNPAQLDGSNGSLKPLINLEYAFGVPDEETSDAPWIGQPDFYAAECQRQNGAHWLNLTTVDTPGDTRTDLAKLIVGSSNNYHVPEVNLTEGNLLTVARNQTDTYVTREAQRKEIADAEARRPVVADKLTAAKKSLKKQKSKVRQAKKKIKKASKKCRKASGAKKKSACKSKKHLVKKKKKAAKKVKQLNRQVKSLTSELEALDATINQ
ncbi:MAG: DUF3089 domain-containing protein [Solirubrobacterales bacterium]